MIVWLGLTFGEVWLVLKPSPLATARGEGEPAVFGRRG
jgi:hypothetical protein